MASVYLFPLDFPIAQMVKNLPVMQKTWVWFLGWEAKQWQPTLVFLPEEFHGQRSLTGYSPWGHKESDTTKQLTHIPRHPMYYVSLSWRSLICWELGVLCGFILKANCLPTFPTIHSWSLYQRQSNKNLVIINFLVVVLDDEFLDAYFKISKYRQAK